MLPDEIYDASLSDCGRDAHERCDGNLTDSRKAAQVANAAGRSDLTASAVKLIFTQSRWGCRGGGDDRRSVDPLGNRAVFSMVRNAICLRS
jgi:hypothetical protein